MEVYAETKNGNVINIDSLYNVNLGIEENLPENIGEIAAKRLLDEMTFVNYYYYYYYLKKNYRVE